MKVRGRIDRRGRRGRIYRRRKVETAINYQHGDPFSAVFDISRRQFLVLKKVRKFIAGIIDSVIGEYNQGKIIIMKRTMIKSIKQLFHRWYYIVLRLRPGTFSAKTNNYTGAKTLSRVGEGCRRSVDFGVRENSFTLCRCNSTRVARQNRARFVTLRRRR